MSCRSSMSEHCLQRAARPHHSAPPPSWSFHASFGDRPSRPPRALCQGSPRLGANCEARCSMLTIGSQLRTLHASTMPELSDSRCSRPPRGVRPMYVFAHWWSGNVVGRGSLGALFQSAHSPATCSRRLHLTHRTSHLTQGRLPPDPQSTRIRTLLHAPSYKCTL